MIPISICYLRAIASAALLWVVAWAALEAHGETNATAVTGSPYVLSLPIARERVLQNHPGITVAELRAVAARAATTVARSAYFPTVSLNGTAVGTGDANTRIAAGGLNNPLIYDRAAVGLSFTQVLTDFGRTSHLTASAREDEKSSREQVLATRAQLLLEVDGAYFQVLRGLALRRVAIQRSDARKLVLEYISNLASNQLRSQLDVSFARVAVEESRLLLDQAETEIQSAQTTLASLTGIKSPESIQVEEVTTALDMAEEVGGMVVVALAHRPEVALAQAEQRSARERQKAETALDYPTLNAFGSGGASLIHDDHLESRFAAAGVNISLPLFNGGYTSGRQRQAKALADAAEAKVRDVEESVMREVRLSWLAAHHACEQIRLTEALVQNADASLALAKARYEQGLSSFLDLNQAELTETSAQVARANAQYEYLMQRDRLEFETGNLK